jgi:hypothetical protein
VWPESVPSGAEARICSAIYVTDKSVTLSKTAGTKASTASDTVGTKASSGSKTSGTEARPWLLSLGFAVAFGAVEVFFRLGKPIFRDLFASKSLRA